eukprot:5330077-Pleurochrysis_carterae.AAC.1
MAFCGLIIAVHLMPCTLKASQLLLVEPVLHELYQTEAVSSFRSFEGLHQQQFVCGFLLLQGNFYSEATAKSNILMPFCSELFAGTIRRPRRAASMEKMPKLIKLRT